jgi:hypothetical protein
MPKLLHPLIGDRREYFQGRFISKVGPNKIAVSFENGLREPLQFANGDFEPEQCEAIYQKSSNRRIFNFHRGRDPRRDERVASDHERLAAVTFGSSFQAYSVSAPVS